MKLYHLSDENHNGKIFHPILMTPDRAMYGEDCTIARTCFSKSIQGAISALCDSIDEFEYGKKFYVHVPKNTDQIQIQKPTIDQVPDCDITGEYWVLNDVEMSCIGQIKITTHIDNYYYGKYRGFIIKINKYNWKWLEKFPV